VAGNATALVDHRMEKGLASRLAVRMTGFTEGGATEGKHALLGTGMRIMAVPTALGRGRRMRRGRSSDGALDCTVAGEANGGAGLVEQSRVTTGVGMVTEGAGECRHRAVLLLPRQDLRVAANADLPAVLQQQAAMLAFVRMMAAQAVARDRRMDNLLPGEGIGMAGKTKSPTGSGKTHRTLAGMGDPGRAMTALALAGASRLVLVLERNQPGMTISGGTGSTPCDSCEAKAAVADEQEYKEVFRRHFDGPLPHRA
jgi:hypothetical protein